LEELKKVHCPLVDLAVLGLQAAQNILDERKDHELKLVRNRDLCPWHSVRLANKEASQGNGGGGEMTR